MAALRRLANFITTLLRELGDEAAYQRRLRRDGRAHSAEEWRRFIDERLKAKYSRAKCC
ncbi:MAG TPA: hypothetical protein VFA28_10005 [Bryobacteraceae bacterium]|jgi:hypothetical protein|nr:hypothetical protein [Bryobacteraceae bacterium]